ncbi:hypothetical protein AAV35_002795 [Salimicrobium jeotgali]|uniref:AraC family transcriptional regulator n=1 Tax=Salimicrobium jeotgali TaxID=1230341 RepID=K2HBA0_9BACI|nr:AraC family transcriptional regulator [Salimicrobium jeotgali]AKG03816.1 hypothetical protein AAV35_002795 [Salimicrobium jeotgali]EKE32835.1 AraC family transcriptional regulator [Salimicrobium jeotgali]MBM7695174.1 AraC-like DNA-binding protein [Salimicrobium jeotgali]
MNSTNEKKFKQLYDQELFNLQNTEEKIFATIIKEEEYYFAAVCNSKQSEAYRRIENIADILAGEKDPQERVKDYRRFFVYLAGASAERFSKRFVFAWEFLATAVSLMKLVESWETEEDFRTGMYFMTDTFMHTVNTYSLESPSHPQVMKFIQYVDEHLYDQLSVTLIADGLGMSPGHLARLVRTHLDTTCNEYIKRKKLEESVLLLQDMTLPIRDIADRIGISNGHFIRIFQEKYSCSPSEYRKRIVTGITADV